MKSRGLRTPLYIALLVAVAVLAHAQTLTVLYSFTNGADGGRPFSKLVRDSAGNLYGSTSWGGASIQGTVFKLSVTGKETVLYSFKGETDGASPFAGVVPDATGNLYGTTSDGGPFWGTVFRLNKAGKEQVLHRFKDGRDGGHPLAAVLIRDMEGALYGTTSGENTTSSYGTVFKIDRTGKETVLYSFTGGADGAYPEGGLTKDPAGNLYGTTSGGGDYGGGTVFKIDTTGKETVLHSFGGQDGGSPEAGLVQDAKGNLYGTANGGGTYNYGVVFKVTKSGEETVLYSFQGDPADGKYPASELIRDAEGNLYGTTQQGGDGPCDSGGCGTVFRLDPAGNETVLHSFENSADGVFPHAGLILDAEGNLYGTASAGGPSDAGAVFKLSP